MDNELKQDFTRRITQANSSELVVILYEMFDIYFDDVRKSMNLEDKSAFHENIRKCTGCIRELNASVISGTSAEEGLVSLYIYCMKELAMADLHYSVKNLDNVQMVMDKLHKTFEEVSKVNQSGAIMGNTQQVYAGFTYGRGSEVVQHMDGNPNRGYTV